MAGERGEKREIERERERGREREERDRERMERSNRIQASFYERKEAVFVGDGRD